MTLNCLNIDGLTVLNGSWQTTYYIYQVKLMFILAATININLANWFFNSISIWALHKAWDLIFKAATCHVYTVHYSSLLCLSVDIVQDACKALFMSCLWPSPNSVCSGGFVLLSIISIFRLLSTSFMKAVLLGHTSHNDRLTEGEHILNYTKLLIGGWLFGAKVQPMEQVNNTFLSFF